MEDDNIMNTQQFPTPELIEQIIEPPYEPIEDIQALAQYQAQTTIFTLQATINMTAIMATITMLGKAMRIVMAA